MHALTLFGQLLSPSSNGGSLTIVSDHLQPVVHAAVQSPRQRPLHNCLMKHKAHKWCFIVFKLKFPKALEDACDAKVVVHGAVEVAETVTPVVCSFQLT